MFFFAEFAIVVTVVFEWYARRHPLQITIERPEYEVRATARNTFRNLCGLYYLTTLDAISRKVLIVASNNVAPERYGILAGGGCSN